MKKIIYNSKLAHLILWDNYTTIGYFEWLKYYGKNF